MTVCALHLFRLEVCQLIWVDPAPCLCKIGWKIFTIVELVVDVLVDNLSLHFHGLNCLVPLRLVFLIFQGYLDMEGTMTEILTFATTDPDDNLACIGIQC